MKRADLNRSNKILETLILILIRQSNLISETHLAAEHNFFLLQPPAVCHHRRRGRRRRLVQRPGVRVSDQSAPGLEPLDRLRGSRVSRGCRRWHRPLSPAGGARSRRHRRPRRVPAPCGRPDHPGAEHLGHAARRGEC